MVKRLMTAGLYSRNCCEEFCRMEFRLYVKLVSAGNICVLLVVTAVDVVLTRGTPATCNVFKGVVVRSTLKFTETDGSNVPTCGICTAPPPPEIPPALPTPPAPWNWLTPTPNAPCVRPPGTSAP